MVTPGFEIPALMTWTGILGRGQSSTKPWCSSGGTSRRRSRSTSPCGAPRRSSCSATCPYAFQVPYMYGFGACWDFIMSWIAFDK